MATEDLYEVNENQPASATTGCLCTKAGFCERHQCEKTEHWVSLCQNRPDYFQLWEAGTGPGQNLPSEPGLARKAGNFGKAVVKHVANRRKQTSDEVYAARIEICNSCELLNQERRVCTDKSCGCFVDKKARWASESCPEEYWLAETQTSEQVEN